MRIPNTDIPDWRIVLSFHHKEKRSSAMAAVLFLTTSSTDLSETERVVLGSDREFTYSAYTDAIERGFREWLDEGLVRLLDAWQSRI